MPTGDVHTLSQGDGKFAVGWQRLTPQEFLDAISAAVLERLPRNETDQSEKPNVCPDARAE
jgi:hypothetical protein